MYAVRIGFEKSIQNLIQFKRFSQNVIQIHPIIFGFVRFSIFFDRLAVLIWIGLDLNTPMLPILNT